MTKAKPGFIRWWHDRGYNTRVISVDAKKREIVIGTSYNGMRLTITRPEPLGDWHVECQIPQTEKADDAWNVTIARRTFTHNEIRCAFGLEDKIKYASAKDEMDRALDKQWIDKYRVDVGVRRKFMRQGNKLNIPDSNSNFVDRRAVSVLITKDMQRLFLDIREATDAAILGDSWPRA